jgi:hypothetical protein
MDDNNNTVDEPITLSIEGPNFFKIGFWLTLVYVGSVVGFSLWDWIDMRAMKPHEWGDFLAGVFGPLALLWVVLGFLQQGSELRNSRDALLLQAEELRHSVEAQKDLGQAAWAQVGEERQNRAFATQQAKQSSAPRISALGGGGQTSGGEKTAFISIHNDGFKAIRLQFSVEDERISLNVKERSVLKNGESYQLKLKLLSGEFFNDTVLTVQYDTLDGQTNEIAFDLFEKSGLLHVKVATGRPLTDC